MTRPVAVTGPVPVAFRQVVDRSIVVNPSSSASEPYSAQYAAQSSSEAYAPPWAPPNAFRC